MIRLTQFAQQRIGDVLPTGGFAVDATAGNGHDTLFLARRVGSSGRVIAIDNQPSAIENTRKKLADESVENVELILGNHADLRTWIPENHRCAVGAVMFNLGYRPGGDEQHTTQADSSVLAIDAAIDVLSDDGLITVLAYPGHPAGTREMQAITDAIEVWALRERISWERIDVQHPSERTPVLFLIEKRKPRVCSN